MLRSHAIFPLFWVSSFDLCFIFSSQHVMLEPFEPSPFMPARGFDNDDDAVPSKQQGLADGNIRQSVSEREISTKETNVAKIKVVVSKLPIII